MNTLYQGDCLLLMKDLADNSIDAIITDPPYNLLNHKIESNISIPDFMVQAFRVLKPDGVFCYFGKVPSIFDWFAEAKKYMLFKEEIIWDKTRASSPNHHILKTHENIFIHANESLNEVFLDLSFCYANQYKDVQGFDRINSALKQLLSSPQRLREYANYLENPKSQFTSKCHRVEQEGTVISKKFMNAADWVNATDIIRRGYKARSVVTFLSGNCSSGENFKHPTVKPEALMEFIIQICSNAGELILDPFMGTGTTIVAAEKLGRNSIGMEIIPEYFNMAQGRLKPVEKENTLF